VGIQDPIDSVNGTTGQLSETDQQGQSRQRLDAFEFPLPTEERKFWAASWHADYGLAFGAGTITPTSPKATLAYAMTPAKGSPETAISVRFLDLKTGAPLENISAYLTSDAFGSLRITSRSSDAEGRIAFRGLSPPPAAWGPIFEGVFHYTLNVDTFALIDGKTSTLEVSVGRPMDIGIRLLNPKQ
jgi:hypothetical protein